MKTKIIGIIICTLLITTIFSTTSMGNTSTNKKIQMIIKSGQFQDHEFGDAPEGDNAIAYPSTGVLGGFPTCKCLTKWMGRTQQLWSMVWTNF
jgi:hypothetical protein